MVLQTRTKSPRNCEQTKNRKEVIKMMKIALSLWPEPSPVHVLARQCGVDHAVTHIDLNPIADAEPEQQPWSYTSLAKAKASYEKAGFKLDVIESRPPMEKTKLGLPGRDEEIEVVCQFLRNMGKAGIPVWCSVWMPVHFVIRTSVTLPGRGGANVSGFQLKDMTGPLCRDIPICCKHSSPNQGGVTEEEQWANLKYFLERVSPVAEEANVKMAIHPADPPLSPVQGVARIMSSVENYQKLVDLVPSPSNGICLCQGNFTLMTDDLPSVIRHFGEQKKVFFVHFRDVRGTPDNFAETFHDDGKTDMAACIRAYRDVGFEGVGRPDHYPRMGDDSFSDDYSFARIFAIGYFRGLLEAAHSE